MANPQTKDGYTKISNDILDALVKTRVPGEARQVLDFIIRKTYGFQKKYERISNSQFSISTGIIRPHVSRALRILFDMNIITQKGNDIYGLQKNFDIWKPLPKKVTVTIKGNKQTQKGNKQTQKGNVLFKETYKETYKDTCKEHPDEAKTPLLKVIKAYRIKRFPEIQELEEPIRTKEIGKWNRLNIPKLSKYAKELIDYIGNWESAVICIDELGTEFDDNPNIQDWSLAAISKNASRWKLKQYQGRNKQ